MLSVLLSITLMKPPTELSLPNQDGKPVSLGDFMGRYVLVYFYPKDSTPGCTLEAQSLRDAYPRFAELGIVALGVSRQGAASHTAFRTEQNLPFDLLSDEDGAFAKALGVERYPLVGLHKRKSVLFGPDGTVLKRFDSVSPAKHAQEVIAFVESHRASKR